MFKIHTLFSLNTNFKVILYHEEKVMIVTKLKQLESEADHKRAISENENVVVISGRMSAEYNPYYGIAEQLEGKYKHVRFYFMDYDSPVSQAIRSIPEVQRFKEVPITVYYKNGLVVNATSNVQNKDEIVSILDKEFSLTVTEGKFNWWW